MNSVTVYTESIVVDRILIVKYDFFYFRKFEVSLKRYAMEGKDLRGVCKHHKAKNIRKCKVNVKCKLLLPLISLLNNSKNKITVSTSIQTDNK